jgi:DNA-binding response OmpR family regulator
VPILLVEAGADVAEQLRALEAGASQLVNEPTSTRVLAAQLRRLIDVAHPRRPQEFPEVRFGPLRLDLRLAAASVGDTPVALTGGEFEVLLLLASRPGEPVHRQTIARTLGRADSAVTRRSADMHVCRIRRKLRDAGGASLQIETAYGRGYLLRLRSESAAREDAREDARVVEWSV